MEINKIHKIKCLGVKIKICHNKDNNIINNSQINNIILILIIKTQVCSKIFRTNKDYLSTKTFKIKILKTLET